MTEQENTAIIGDDEIITDEIEESEQGGNEAHNREVKRRRRLTPEETRILSEIYEHTQKPNSVLRNRLAQELGMSSRQIQIWFQNRRAKIKRDVNDPMGTDSASKLYFPNDPPHPYYMQYPPGTISNTIQNGAPRPLGMLNIASKPIIPVPPMNGVFQQKQYPIGITQPMNSFPLSVTSMSYSNQAQSSAPLQTSQQGNINYGYSIRSQGIQSAKQMQNSYIQTTAAGQTGNIQRIISGNTMMPIQPIQSIRSSNQINTSPVPPMYTQSSSQVPIYTTAPNTTVQSYTTNATNLSPLQSMSFPSQKNEQLNSRNALYMNYPTTQTTQGSPSITQNNIYMSNVPNVYDMNKGTTAPSTMVYSQNVIPATNIVNSGVPSTVTLVPNNSAVITPSPLSRPVTTVSNQANQINKMVQNTINPVMISDNKTDLAKKVPIATISSVPTISNIIPNQPYRTIQTNISKLASTGMPTSPIKAIINSSINSKVAAKAASAAALKQENNINQNISNLYNIDNNNNMAISHINNSNQGSSEPSKATKTVNTNNDVKDSIDITNNDKDLATNAINTSKVNTTVPSKTNDDVNLKKENLINDKVNTENVNIIKDEIIKQNEEKNLNSFQNIEDKNSDNIKNNDQIVKNNINDENLKITNENLQSNSVEVINPDNVTKIDSNIEVLDSMLYNPKSKLESDELPLNNDIINPLDSSKNQNNKFLKDITLYENNDSMKWLEDDVNWNQTTQLSQFPLPIEDKKNQKENESKDLESLNGLNTNDSSFNDNNTQLWLSDDIDYLLQSENFKV